MSSPEIWKDLNGHMDVFVAGVGTGIVSPMYIKYGSGVKYFIGLLQCIQHYIIAYKLLDRFRAFLFLIIL